MAQALQVLRSYNVIHLRLEATLKGERPIEDMDDIEWLRILHRFSTVQTLHVYWDYVEPIARALENITAEMQWSSS